MRLPRAVRIAVAVTVAAPLFAADTPGVPPAALADLVAVERAFARAAFTAGVREAFLEYLADGAMVLRPHAVDARQWYLEDRPVEGTLEWSPVFADLAADGTLGYTTGPWEFRRKATLEASTYGHYVAVWKKQADGAWRVVIDLGTTHPARKRDDDTLSWPTPSLPPAAAAAPAAARETLIELDRTFAAEAEREGAITAYERHASKQIRLYRNDRFPALGWKAARSVLKGKPGSLTWEPRSAEVAASGDLGYTYGTARSGDRAATEAGSYARIWRLDKDGAWTLVLDILVPAPGRLAASESRAPNER